MNKDTAFSNAPNDAFEDPSSPTIIHFCSNCDKPFTSETSRNRHLRYCGSRTRNRPRSCRACNTAKTKCTFEAPCARCTKKGIDCVYEESAAAGRRALPRSSLATDGVRTRSCNRPSVSFPNGPFHMGDETVFNSAFADDLDVDDTYGHLFGDIGSPSLSLSMQKPSLDEPITFDELLSFDQYNPSQHRFSADVSLAPYDRSSKKSGSWCAWMRQGVSLSVATENPYSLAVLHAERPHAQHNADIVIKSLRSFPTMMLRRETFPWFIHPHSHLPSRTRAALPEPLSACMSIAQMFASRTSETKHLLYRAIRAEYRRCTDKVHQMSQFELLAALQACMIYLIIFIIDPSTETDDNGLELVHALHDLCVVFKEVCGPAPDQDEPANKNAEWEHWIFDESQRRLTNLWLLVGCVVCVKTGVICDPSQSYRSIPLCSPKSLWEATTQSAWESQYEASRDGQGHRLVTLGDLIDLQRSDFTPSNARKLDQWNAGVDNLGSLLNLVGTMV